jgi:hypothetical protein
MIIAQVQTATLLIHRNGYGAATRYSSKTSIKNTKSLELNPAERLLMANRVLILRFQLLAVYVLLVHNCAVILKIG